MKKKKQQHGVIWAVALILTGLVILLSSLNVITIKEDVYFFIAIAIVGVVFHAAAFTGKPKKYNLLVPGGMLIIFAALFISCKYSEKLDIYELWPVLILAAAFGMLEQKVFSKGSQGNWASIIVVSVIGFFFLIQSNLSFGIALGALLIVVGVLIVVRLSRHLPSSDKPKGENEDAGKPEDDGFGDI